MTSLDSTNRKVLLSSALFLAVLGMLSDSALAFVPSKPMSTAVAPSRSSYLEVAAYVPTTAEAIQEMSNARFAFGMCFYGALGVGSIGRELIPVVFGRYQKTSSLESGNDENGISTAKKAASSITGDEDLGIWGYPETIYRKDVEEILNNKLTPMEIAKKYPIAKDSEADARYQYTHMKEVVPFLGYDGFCKANPNANPVALRAVFDSFSQSIGGSNAVSPITAQTNIDSFLEVRGKSKRVTAAMAKKLNGGKTLGIAAFGFMLVLLGVGDYLAIYHLWQGWFPEWQGFSDMPASLFDREIGVAVLPSYFVGDVPSVPN